MTHDKICDLIERAAASNKDERENILKEIYELVDEYNGFIQMMDKKFDKVVIKMEALVEDGH